MELTVSESKQAILDAAEQIITQSGYAGLSMRELSKQSGLAKSTLYHYFQDKHQIYLSVLERDMILSEHELHEAAEFGGDAASRLAHVIEVYMDSLNQRGSFAFNALRRAGELDVHLGELFKRHRPLMIAPIAAIIQQGIDDGQFRSIDVEQTVLSLFSMMNGYIAQRLLIDCGDASGGPDSAATARHIADLLLHGLTTTRPA